MEICEEWLYHLGVPRTRLRTWQPDSANTVPVMMPFASAYFQPREAGDRPERGAGRAP
jgi:oleate hydratase